MIFAFCFFDKKYQKKTGKLSKTMFILLENAEKDIIMPYMAEKTYSVSEAAKLLGISTGTLYSRIRGQQNRNFYRRSALSDGIGHGPSQTLPYQCLISDFG